MRNENVAVNPIDNNAIKEANIRVGATITQIAEPRVENSWFAAEFGRPAPAPVVLGAPAKLSGWHGELFESHQNAVFNARTFFQVGGVLPSHQNQYGGRATGIAGSLGALTINVNQRDVRGVVNGNVLVPLATEREPRAADPRLRALVQRFIGAYPKTLPNRSDFDIRALNTNSPQRIDETDASIRLDREAGAKSQVSALYQIARRRTDAFQLVAGQNPDSAVHSHRAQLAWRGSWAPGADFAAGFTFLRTASLLASEPNAVGPRIRVGFQIEELGPDSEFPVNRAQNSFRYGAAASLRVAGDRHRLSWGGDLARTQVNGRESNSARGFFNFTNNFGRPAIQNLLLGVPSYYEVTLGDMTRGFRNWGANLFVADQVKLNARTQIYFGVRYSMVTAPVEVNGLHAAPYRCDCNNVSPRFSLAYQTPKAWVIRASYAVSFGEIPPVTYGQVRYNAPHAYFIQAQNPDLLEPLRGVRLDDPALRTSPTLPASDLVSPYSHQYSLSLERRIGSGMLRAGYIGSRSLKLLNAYIFNRAEPIPGVPLTLDTVDRRRPDGTKYEARHIVNAGIGYFDAGQVSYDLPEFRGLRANISYTFSKGIDQGADFAATAANRDLSRARSQWQYDSVGDKKSLSYFDSPHALVAAWSYDLPRIARAGSAGGAIFNGWQLASVALVKSGTPLTLFIGSDAPGFGNVDGSPSDRPNIVDPSILGKTISHPDAAPLILRRDRFAYITPGEHRGSLGRNTFRKARIANWNAAVTKQWHWGSARERTAMLRWEAYNLTNTPQFDEPQRNLSAPAFGKITNALNDGRVFQIGLRLLM